MLDVRGLVVRYDAIEVLHGVNLQVERGEILCLLGPSGCGKTTLLRAIAGLERPSAGEVRIDGENILPIPVHQRGFGLMFQDFALFPHLNVLDNVTYGLKMAHVSAQERDQRAKESLSRVGLAGFEMRDVNQLSGGEKQRVALARSLAPNPRLLMLDEPLGSLDAALREHLVVELRDIIKRVGLTAIYVTHDQQEAFAVSDRIAVMNAGNIVQIDRPEQVYQNPRTAFVARFMGLDNLLTREQARAFGRDVDTSFVLVHPDGLSLDSQGATLRATVTERVFAGSDYRLRVSTESGIILRLRADARQSVPQIGDAVSLRVEPSAIIPLEGD